MKTIQVEISWEDKNFCCGWGCEDFGAIMCTNKTFEGVKSDFEEALTTQIQDMVADGETIPEWLVNNEYRINFTVSVSALLRQAEQFTTMAVISRVTGINQKLLSHYANAIKIPRKTQRERIVNGLHAIGQQFLAIH